MSDALVAVRPRGGATADAVVRLVVAPPSGAGPQYARPLLDPGVDLWSARYPGRETRLGEPFAPSLEAIAQELATDLLAVHDAEPLPLVLLGNSMGAGVVVELARQVERRRPDALTGVVIAGRAAPGADRPQDVASLRRTAASDADLTVWVRGLGGIPRELVEDAGYLAMLLPVLRADLLVSLDHDAAAGARLTSPVLLACGDADPVVTPDLMRGWSGLTTGHVEQVLLRGGHHAVVEDRLTVLDAVRRLALP